MAIGMAKIHTTSRLEKEMSRVIGRRSMIKSMTGFCHWSDQPKLSWKTLFIHLRYWIYSGWSRPYIRLRFSISAVLSVVPDASS